MYQPSYDEVMQATNTPAYVFDIDLLKERIAYIKKVLGSNIDLCYAMKANPFVVGSIKHDIDKYEVCSPGEFNICERAEVPIHKVVLSGVYKESKDIQRMMEMYKDEITYTCESLQQFLLINETAEGNRIRVRVFLRITTGNQFGIDESVVCDIIRERALYKGVDIIGIQHFSGTQRKKLPKYEEELQYVDDLIERLEKQYNFQTKELEFGPGFYVEYFQNAKPFDELKLLQEFRTALHHMKFKGHITLELGRFIVASCGTYYTKIVEQKMNKNIHFCIVDGGMHQIVYFGQMMAMKLPQFRQVRKSDVGGALETCHIAGSLCTINDNLVKELPLISPQVGDILEFKNAGAYCMCEGISLFLSRDLPKVYLFSEKDKLLLMRDTFETNVLNYKSS